MLLVFDVGNTNIVLGIFDQSRLAGKWRLNTNPRMTRDELGMFVSYSLSNAGLALEKIDRIVASTVVPSLNSVITDCCRMLFHQPPHWAGPHSFASMDSLYTTPKTLGTDRIVNAVAAWEQHKTCLIVIDLGTATTFDAVSEDGTYLGGAISPGMNTMANALYQNAPVLPRVPLSDAPETAIGTDTASSLKSGLLYGYAGLVDGMVSRMAGQMDAPPKVVATGGLSELVKSVCTTIDVVAPDLTLQGLLLISQRL